MELTTFHRFLRHFHYSEEQWSQISVSQLISLFQKAINTRLHQRYLTCYTDNGVKQSTEKSGAHGLNRRETVRREKGSAKIYRRAERQLKQ